MTAPTERQRSDFEGFYRSLYPTICAVSPEKFLMEHNRYLDIQVANAEHVYFAAQAPLLERMRVAEADAARYQWLRDNQMRVDIRRRKSRIAITNGFSNYEFEYFKTLDEAIDAARSAIQLEQT